MDHRGQKKKQAVSGLFQFERLGNYTPPCHGLGHMRREAHAGAKGAISGAVKEEVLLAMKGINSVVQCTQTFTFWLAQPCKIEV